MVYKYFINIVYCTSLSETVNKGYASSNTVAWLLTPATTFPVKSNSFERRGRAYTCHRTKSSHVTTVVKLTFFQTNIYYMLLFKCFLIRLFIVIMFTHTLNTCEYLLKPVFLKDLKNV